MTSNPKTVRIPHEAVADKVHPVLSGYLSSTEAEIHVDYLLNGNVTLDWKIVVLDPSSNATTTRYVSQEAAESLLTGGYLEAHITVASAIRDAKGPEAGVVMVIHE